MQIKNNEGYVVLYMNTEDEILMKIKLSQKEFYFEISSIDNNIDEILQTYCFLFGI